MVPGYWIFIYCRCFYMVDSNSLTFLKSILLKLFNPTVYFNRHNWNCSVNSFNRIGLFQKQVAKLYFY